MDKDVKPLEVYASVVLHSGCAVPPINETESRKHKWNECRAQDFFMRIARKHQHKLKSNGLVIGTWIKKADLIQIREQKGDYLGLLDILIDG